MRIFTVGELWLPLKPCRCGKDSENIILTDIENDSLPERSGSKAVIHIFENDLGIDCCNECLSSTTEEIEKIEKTLKIN